MSALRLIISGDDYGGALSINRAVIQAHEEGILTSTSLMVTGEAVDDAVARARAHPTLAVGLHLVVLDTRGASSISRAPHLTDPKGQLPKNLFAGGVRYFFSPVLRAMLQQEIKAQLERFLETGLLLAHVDGHHLFHLHPTVFSILMPLAEQYGVPGIRLPRDDLRLALALDRSRKASKVTWASVYALLCRWALRRLEQSSIVFTDRVYGFLQTGCMHESFVVSLLRRIPQAVRSAEIYFHPSIRSLGESFGPNEGDLAALLSPRVRQALQERGAQLTNYAALRAGGVKRV